MKPGNYRYRNRFEKIDAHRFLVEQAEPKEYSPATTIADRSNGIYAFKEKG